MQVSTRGKSRSERSSDLGKVTQLVNSKGRILIWVFLMLMSCSPYLIMLPWVSG